jgi:hypothetical protein
MSDSSLIRMANQIAANLKTRSDYQEAITTHLKSFWTPKMLSELKELISENSSDFDETIIEVSANI